LRGTCRDATRLIVIDEVHNLLGERGRIVVSTFELSVGVNVPNVCHVSIWSAVTNQAEIAQMLGGEGRKAADI
jgi:superfamily II DNA or RNA helicase